MNARPPEHQIPAAQSAPFEVRPRPRSDTFHLLFACTHNSARSILAEALLRHHGGARFVAHCRWQRTAVKPTTQPAGN